jgi:transposase
LFQTFDDTERHNAQNNRLQIELDLNRRGLLLQREVVLLEARDEQAFRRTHERYCESLPESVKSPITITR